MKYTRYYIYYYHYHYVLKCKKEKCIWKIFVKYTQIRQSNTNTNISSRGFSNTNTNTNTYICVFKYKYKYKYVFDPSPGRSEIMPSAWSGSSSLIAQSLKTLQQNGPKLKKIFQTTVNTCFNIDIYHCGKKNPSWRKTTPPPEDKNTYVAINYGYRWYKSICKFRLIIDMAFSILIYRVSNLTSAMMG